MPIYPKEWRTYFVVTRSSEDHTPETALFTTKEKAWNFVKQEMQKEILEMMADPAECTPKDARALEELLELIEHDIYEANLAFTNFTFTDGGTFDSQFDVSEAYPDAGRWS